MATKVHDETATETAGTEYFLNNNLPWLGNENFKRSFSMVYN